MFVMFFISRLGTLARLLGTSRLSGAGFRAVACWAKFVLAGLRECGSLVNGITLAVADFTYEYHRATT